MTLRHRSGHAPARRALLGLLALLCAGIASCSSLNFERETATSGTFEATGWAFTILSIDLPKGALDIARENVSDARQPNVRVTEASVWPHLGWFDLLFEIIGFRRARIAGTWGFAPDAANPGANEQSN